MTPRKTAAEISAAIIAQLETSLNSTIPLLPKAFTRVLAKALGGIFVLLYQFAGFVLLQMFVKTASNKPFSANGVEITPLKEWGALVDINQKTGQRAEHTIAITVLVQGGTLTSGTRIVNTATELIYTLIGDVSLNAATVYGDIRATEVGEIGNVDVGTSLDFVSPPAAVEKAVTTTVIVQVGVDPETTEEYRDRILERFGAAPQGGAYADYRLWAEEVEGVLNAYPYSGWTFEESYPTGGPGYVFVFIESTSDTDGIPPDPGALLTAVAANIEQDQSGLASRRNINARVEVKPITRTAFTVVVAGLSTEDDVAAKAAITSGLTDFFLDREPFVTGVSIPPRKDDVNVAAAAGVVSEIAEANGGTIAYVSLYLAPNYITSYLLQEGEKAKLDTVLWI